MDKNARLALVGIAGMTHVKMQEASKARSVSPRICEEPPKVCASGFLKAYESGEDNLLREPGGVKHKLSRVADEGLQRPRRVCVR